MSESKLTFQGVEFTAPYGDVMVSVGSVLCQIRALSSFVDVANMQPPTSDEVQAIRRALDVLEGFLMSDAEIQLDRESSFTPQAPYEVGDEVIDSNGDRVVITHSSTS